MSAQVLFNQFAYADRLKRGGFSDDQARASAEALGDALTETVAERLEGKELEDAGRSGAELFHTAAKLDVTMVELKGELAAFKTDLTLGPQGSPHQAA